MVERLVVAGHPARPPHQQPGRVDPGLHVGELERDGLEVADLAAELLALPGVLQRVLVGRAGHAERHRADGGPGPLEGLHRGLARRLLPSRTRGDPLVELLLAADDQPPGNADVVEHHLGGVRRADAVLLELLALAEALRVRAG